MATIVVSYLTSIPGRSELADEARRSKSSASSFVVSRVGEKITAPIVIPSNTTQEVISAGSMSYFLAIMSQELSGNETSNYTV